MNIRLIATQFGNRLKYDTSLNEIDRIGQSVLKIPKENFPNDAITSRRAKSIYDWLMSLGKTPLSEDERITRLVSFALELTPIEEKERLQNY